MFVQEPKQIQDRWHRSDLAAFVARERIVTTAGEACGSDLTQTKLTPDTTDFLALSLTIPQHQFVTRGCVTPRAVGVELDLTARFATPT
jgi:hypothetical protein